MVLPPFGFVSIHRQPLPDGIAREAAWLARAAECGRAAAHLWQAPPGFVVPRRYALQPGWDAAAAAQPAGSLQVRASGGGLVPQGPGIWNLSLVWPTASATPVATDAVYRELCAQLAIAFARLGLDARPGAVDGSFCDGRYNLAVAGRKLVGTAQSWKRVGGRPTVLAHAVIVVDADPQALAGRASDFERQLGSATRYRAESLTSVAIATGERGIEGRTLQLLAEQFARAIPPCTPEET